LEKTIQQLVSKGTLETHLVSVHREINPKMAAWYSKASYLLDLYRESDSYVSHLLAAVYLYATRLNYVSPDLEWLANAFVAEMKMKIEMQGDSTTWTPETRATYEADIRHAFFDYKAKADTLLGKGVVRPLFDPDKIRKAESPRLWLARTVEEARSMFELTRIGRAEPCWLPPLRLISKVPVET
jgi:hypothetical protein